MFHACVAIIILIMVMCMCTVMAIIDLTNYNFGLYIILLCIVGIMLACALCVANPNACKNPAWYTRFCLLLQELHPEHLYHSSATPNMNDAAFSTSECTADNTTYRLRIENRAAIAMLMPAVHLMHHIWNGLAWVAEDISDEEKVANYQTDVSASGPTLMKLSTIIVSSSNQPSIPIPEDSISGWDPRNDIIL